MQEMLHGICRHSSCCVENEALDRFAVCMSLSGCEVRSLH